MITLNNKKLPLYLTIFFILLSSLSLYFLTGGNVREITADFGLYYRPIDNIKNSNCDLIKCIDFFNSYNLTDDAERIWIVSPFYSLIFLLPISIFNSDLLYLFQGITITLLILFLLHKILNHYYSFLNDEKLINWIILLSFLNYPFIKDSLSSGPMSVCTLFVLLAFYYYPRNKYKTVLFGILAATIRPNFIFIYFSFFIGLIIFKPKNYKKVIFISIPSFVSYLISYALFYSSNPGSIVSNLFMTSFRNFNQFYDLVIPILPIENKDELFRWQPNFSEVFILIFSNIKLIYAVILIYVMKIFHFLGYLGPDLLWDHRNLFIQRLPGLFYSLVIMIPAFYMNAFFSIFNYFKKVRYFKNWELFISAWSLIYILLHSIYLGDPRYLIGIHFIYVIIFLRLISFFIGFSNSFKIIKKV